MNLFNQHQRRAQNPVVPGNSEFALALYQALRPAAGNLFYCYLKCVQIYAPIRPQRFNLLALRWSFRSPLITRCWVQPSLQLESCP